MRRQELDFDHVSAMNESSHRLRKIISHAGQGTASSQELGVSIFLPPFLPLPPLLFLLPVGSPLEASWEVCGAQSPADKRLRCIKPTCIWDNKESCAL